MVVNLCFHDLLPVFVPNTTIVLFVFKLSEGLNEKPIVLYYGPDGPIGGAYESYLNHREILEHCIKVFRAQDHKRCPTILLVGTHKDIPEQRLDIKELKECLKPFQQEVIHFGSQPIAMLNCLSSGKEERQIVEEVRKEILNVADKMESRGDSNGLVWTGTCSKASKPRSKLKNVKVFCLLSSVKWRLIRLSTLKQTVVNLMQHWSTLSSTIYFFTIKYFHKWCSVIHKYSLLWSLKLYSIITS